MAAVNVAVTRLLLPPGWQSLPKRRNGAPKRKTRSFEISRPTSASSPVQSPIAASRNPIWRVRSPRVKQRVHLPTASSTASAVPSPDNEPSSVELSLSWSRKDIGVWVVLFAVFLHLLGFTVTGPILPALTEHFNLPHAKVGYLTSSYPLGMFFALFVWPKLSDAIGRKPVIVFSLLGVGIGFVLQGIAVAQGWPLWTFLALRVGSGALAGASPVVKAYIADVTPVKDLPKFMGWREAACTLAFIVGPTLGGFLFTTWSLAPVISISGWASICAALLVAYFLTEDDPPGGRVSAKDAPGIDETAQADEPAPCFSCPLGTSLVVAVGTICVVSFLYNTGQATYDAFFTVMASSKFHLTAQQIGYMLTGLAMVSLSVSAFGFAAIQRRAGITVTSVLGLTLVATGLAGIGFTSTPLGFIACAAVYVVGVPLYTPSVPILLMQCVPPSKRGFIMGLDSAVNTVGRILGPIAFGVLYAAQGASACFYTASAIVICAALFTLVRWLIVLRSP